jgi:hypothetical protein
LKLLWHHLSDRSHFGHESRAVQTFSVRENIQMGTTTSVQTPFMKESTLRPGLASKLDAKQTGDE